MGTVRYTTVNGEVIAEKRSGVRRQYVPDPLGSTVALLDSTQAATDTFAYWPYGEEASRAGTTETPFRFVGTMGYYRDAATRRYVRARHLDTRAGRWTTKDPIGFGGGTLNIYAYCGVDPVGVIDPSGLKLCGKRVRLTSYGNLASDKVGTNDNPLKPGDIAVGHWGVGRRPRRRRDGSYIDPWTLPFGTDVWIYPDGEEPFPGNVADVGAFDKVHPDQGGPADWIDIWDPEKSKKQITRWGRIVVQVGDCDPCPKGYSEQLAGWDPFNNQFLNPFDSGPLSSLLPRPPRKLPLFLRPPANWGLPLVPGSGLSLRSF